ncbi:MAG: hypothetical protein GEU79_06295 [Acidimicrobiia bacterium]|nr:hypothetical protein [Acidimicrobiia bacterium]
MAIAHRGAHDGGREENSLEAVRRAIDLGARAVEFDVCNTVDGNLVISHDRWVTWEDGSYDITQTTLGKEQGFSTVDDHLKTMADADDVLLNLDWKGCGWEERVGELLDRHGLTQRTIVSGTDSDALARVKHHLPEVATGLSVDTAHHDLGNRMRRCGASAVMVFRGVVSIELVESIRGAGGGVFVWTAPDVATFHQLSALGPDGIATDAIAAQLSVGGGTDTVNP